jgi:hypothetical protein
MSRAVEEHTNDVLMIESSKLQKKHQSWTKHSKSESAFGLSDPNHTSVH